MTAFYHSLLSLVASSYRNKFCSSLASAEKAQRSRLAEILSNLDRTELWESLKGKSYEELRTLVPLANYSYYSDKIAKQKASHRMILSSEIVRYEPTSGSTESRKWIPYSAKFLEEINRAAMAWIGDVYRQFPQIKSGTHYWSLSWLPTDLRGLTTTDDVELFRWWHRKLIRPTMAVDPRLARVTNPEAAWWATLVSLASRHDLTLVSVWSPTFWLKVCSDIEANYSEIKVALNTGKWGRFEEELAQTIGQAPTRKFDSQQPIDLKSLWPSLKVISAWDSSSSSVWANQLKKQFPQAIFQGKGLWATEGVVTIPFEDKKVLAINSHFFEFIDLETGEVLPAWSVQQGREYKPVLWTSSGLLRYVLEDRVRVTGWLEKTPCFEFLGRIQSVDLVGEKIYAPWVHSLLEARPEWRGICLVACHKPSPHYVLVHQGGQKINVEDELRRLHHYDLARQLGQLGPAQTLEVNDVFELLKKTGTQKILGQNKVEVLIEVDRLHEL